MHFLPTKIQAYCLVATGTATDNCKMSDAGLIVLHPLFGLSPNDIHSFVHKPSPGLSWVSIYAVHIYFVDGERL